MAESGWKHRLFWPKSLWLYFSLCYLVLTGPHFSEQVLFLLLKKKPDQPTATNLARFTYMYVYSYHCVCCPSQGAVPLQPKLIQAPTVATPPLPPSPAAHSQPSPGTTDCATTLSSLSQTDLGNWFTEIQPHQIKGVLFSSAASLKERAVQLETVSRSGCKWGDRDLQLGQGRRGNSDRLKVP